MFSFLFSLRFFFIISSLLHFAAAESKCYALDGSKLDDTFGPCDPDAKHSGCCAIHGSPGLVDVCLSNGLCMATNQEYMGTIWQSGCTDPTGMDPSCPKMCPDVRDDFGNGSSVVAWNVQMCDFGSYCCREVGDRNNCCNNATAPQIKTMSIGSFLFETSTAGAAPTKTSTPTHSLSEASATSPPSTSPTATSFEAAVSDMPELCAAEKHQTKVVGGALAGFACFAITSLLAAVFYLFLKEKKQRKLKEHYEEQFAKQTWGAYGSGHPSRATIVEDNSPRTPEKAAVEVRYIGRQNTS